MGAALDESLLFPYSCFTSVVLFDQIFSLMTYSITATKRTNMRKRSRDEREARRVPGVVYGVGIEPKPISVERSAFLKLWKAAGFSSLIDFTCDEQSSVKVLIKDIQLDHLTMDPMHVDFHQIRMDQKLTAKIPLKFIGEAPAVKVSAGTLIKSLDEVEVTCLPADLPHEIEIDLATLVTFDDAITVGNLKLPEGVITSTDASLTIATVARPFTEDELKKMDESGAADISSIKTEGEEKRAAEEAKKAAEAAADDTTTKKK